jgi:hypothetical protein
MLHVSIAQWAVIPDYDTLDIGEHAKAGCDAYSS